MAFLKYCMAQVAKFNDRGAKIVKQSSLVGKTQFQRGPANFLRSGILCSRLPKLIPKAGKWNFSLTDSPKLQVVACRSFRQSAFKRCNFPPTNSQPVKMSTFNSVTKPLLFTALVGVGSVTCCTIWQYEAYRSSISRTNLRTLFRTHAYGEKRGDLRQKVHEWWHSLPPGEQMFWPICAINTLVYVGWKIPSMSPLMVKWFSTNPYSRAVALPMLLSVFSHYSFFHLAANMFVLHSFTPTATHILGREQFVAMYVTSGVVASLGSHFHKLWIKSAVPSLGASGAIMGVLGLVCSSMPDIPLGILFIPNLSFSADTALKCILALDTVGVLANWRFFDHAAHLSGCLFGIFVSKFGTGPINGFRDTVTKRWHDYRNQRQDR